MPNSNVKLLKKETYIKAIENSVGSKIFNTLYVQYEDSGKVEDILDDGNFSCAYNE